MVTQLTTIVFL